MSTPPSPRATASPAPQRPAPSTVQTTQPIDSTSATSPPPDATSSQTVPKKKRSHRGGKKKRSRRRSFATSIEDGSGMPETQETQDVNAQNAAMSSFYRLQGRNLSNTSLESEALLDHRDQQSMKPRRSSTVSGTFGQSIYASPTSYRPQYHNPFKSSDNTNVGSRNMKRDSGLEGDEIADERAPLLPNSARAKSSGAVLRYGHFGAEPPKLTRDNSNHNKRSSSTSSSHSRKKTIFDKQNSAFPHQNEEYNVNYPPSVPGSPRLDPARREMSFGDMMVREDFKSPMGSPRRSRDNISEHAIDDSSQTASPKIYDGRRHTIALQAEEDVCFPIEEMSELADEDMRQAGAASPRRQGGARRRRGKWPDLAMLDDWSRFEKEGRNEERRAKRITEPQLIGGRLRPIHKGWHRAEDDAPYRFTYFNEEFQSTIHSQTISELVQPGSSFRELFVPDPPVLSDSESDDQDEEFPLSRDDSQLHHTDGTNGTNGTNGESTTTTRQSSLIGESKRTGPLNAGDSRRSTDATHPINGVRSPDPHTLPNPSPDVMKEKPKRYGERPTWWLDVLSPTDAEMKVLSKTFGIHPLTAEDIMMQEAREKVELFQNYYFVNYRSFEQDMNKEDFLEPVNMYVVVFRQGVISFHFSLTPHPANVRRRIRQLKDYLILSSDWISYAIIDDITDVFAPLIQSIEDDVDDIDDAILKLHSSSEEVEKVGKDSEKKSEAGDGTSGESGGDMLRRVGDCRKKVMGLYRLLGNKADVIKGFAKRCNEHWEIAPRSEIGLYLGDIQDHIVTMTGNLSHYEKILARSHANYLAQINIRMNERQEQTADVLGKLTVLGTIVLPMNIITGLWGMNVWVPGQEHEADLTWFFWITAGLLCFGCACFFIARALYRIV